MRKHKDFNCPKKTEARKLSCFDPIKETMGGIPKGKIYATFSGAYNSEFENNEFSEGVREGAFLLNQYFGFDMDPMILIHNKILIRNWKKNIKCENYLLGSFLMEHKNRIGFLHIDTQQELPNAICALFETLNIMKDIHGFGVCLNSIIVNGNRKHFDYVPAFETVEEVFKRNWEKELKKASTQNAELLKQLTPLCITAYDGAGKSESVMVAITFLKK